MAENNSALFYAIAGIVFMSMIVPMVLNPFPVMTYTYTQPGANRITITGQASARPNNPPLSVACVDHDGNDIYTKSYVTYKGVNYMDSCSGSGVTEMLCSPDKKGNLVKNAVTYPCPYGCNEGACNPKPAPQISCTDSDHGLIQEIQGTVSGYKADSSYYSYSDNCPSTDKLVEYYCSNNQPFFTEIPCTPFVNGTMVFNYVCENGACILK
jgi:hypothetical protein